MGERYLEPLWALSDFLLSLCSALQVKGHYLRPNISDGNISLAPHFIHVQILQVHFQEMKKTATDHKQSMKEAELNFLKSVRYLTQESLQEYLPKNICYFRSPISP